MNLKITKFNYIKYNIFIIFLLSFSLIKSQVVVFSGKIVNPNSDKISIRNIGYKKEIKVSKDGEFRDTLNVKSGEYTLTDFNESTTIYLEPGYNIHLSLNTAEFDESIKYEGIGEKPNNFLASYFLFNEINTISNKKYNLLSEDDHFNLETKKHKEIMLMLEKAVDNNESFVSLQKDKFNYMVLNNILRKSGDSFFSLKATNLVTKFIENALKNINFKDTLQYKTNRNYKSFFNNYFTLGLVADNQNCYNTFNNDLTNTQKSNITKLIGRGISFYNNKDITPFYDALEKIIDDNKELAIYKSLYERITSLNEGSSSPLFSYKSIDNKTVSLKDLKDHLVYIDVWATWCGPCKAQIPYLKQLEENYKGKAIEFVSISIDQLKDEDKWRKMVKEKELKGIQLIADNAWKSSFVKDYVIQGIPRFILLDKKGDIISPFAPQPGAYNEKGNISLNPEITELINQHLD
jgi:thiol-disulfide isomerase/thioredoxin